MDLARRNNVNMMGQGPRTLLFAHGYGCDQNMWRLVAPAFAARHRVVLFDHVGAGGSDLSAYDPCKYDTLSGYADDVLALCAAFATGPVTFVGHSVSALIGVLAAIKDPTCFDAQVLIAPSPCYLDDPPYQGGFRRADIDDLLATLDSNFLGWSSAMAPAIMGNPDRPELGQELTNSFCRTDPNIAKHFARVTFSSDHRAELARMPVRSLILQCRDDVIAPLSVGIYMNQQMPFSQLHVLRATGHCPHLSAPDEVVAAMQEFLG